MRPSGLGMQQSLPQCRPGGEVAASLHQRGVQQSRTLWRGLHPQPGRHISRDTFSQLCPQRITEDQLPLWLWRQNQQQQQQEEANCSSVPAPMHPFDFLDLQKAAGRKAGRRRGQEDRNLLPERTGRFHGWGRMTPFQQIAGPPPNHSHLGCASTSVHCECLYVEKSRWPRLES